MPTVRACLDREPSPHNNIVGNQLEYERLTVPAESLPALLRSSTMTPSNRRANSSALIRTSILALSVCCCTGCASLTRQKAECSWIEIGQQDRLVASGVRTLIRDNVGRMNCGSSANYRFQSDAYEIEFWTGEDTEPRLFLRAVTPDGRTLSLQSPDLVAVAALGQSVYGQKAMAYRYVLDTRGEVGGRRSPITYPHVIALTVTDDGGNILGRQSFSLRTKVRRLRLQ